MSNYCLHNYYIRHSGGIIKMPGALTPFFTYFIVRVNKTLNGFLIF